MSEKSEPEQLRKLFICGLNYRSTEMTLVNHFKKWGKIVDCGVTTDPYTRESKGFGFINYEHAHMVDKAQAARPHKIDGRQVVTKRAVAREDSDNPEARVTVNKLCVSGINEDMSEEDLRGYFGAYGHVVSVDIIITDTTSKKSGYAVVKFDDYDPVDKILLQRRNYRAEN